MFKPYHLDVNVWAGERWMVMKIYLRGFCAQTKKEVKAFLFLKTNGKGDHMRG